MSLQQSIDAATQVCADLPGWRKLSPATRITFATDVALVARALRTGHLVDAISYSDPDILSQLARRIKVHPAFSPLVHVYHGPTGQSFIANKSMLLQRAKHTASSNTGHVSGIALFIHLNTSDAVEPESLPSKALLRTIVDLATHLEEMSPEDTFVPVPTNIGIDILVPLAAFILEYPVAYVPNPKQTTFLSQVPLDVHEVIISSSGTSHFQLEAFHSLLKFSVPRHLALSHPACEMKTLQRSLQEVYTRRAHDAFGATATITTQHSVQIHDRVAL